MIFFIREENKNSKYNASGKARWDCTEMLEKNKNFKKINYNFTTAFSTIISAICFIIRSLLLSKKDTLIIQTHFKGFDYLLNYLYFLGNIKKIKMVFIIHDLEGLRSGNAKLDRLEMKCLKNSFVLCHTEKMKQYILQNTIVKKIEVINIFPYLLKLDYINYDRYYDFCYAGNLTKSKFIEKMDESILKRLALFGVKGQNEFLNCNYFGAISSNIIPYRLNGKFGIIWDGDSTEGCYGINESFIRAEYIKYNSPHKFAMYIAAGIPVICWSQAGIANFVIANNLGLVVDSLNDLRDLNIDSEYKKFVSGVLKLRKSIINGEYFFNKLINLIC